MLLVVTLLTWYRFLVTVRVLVPRLLCRLRLPFLLLGDFTYTIDWGSSVSAWYEGSAFGFHSDTKNTRIPGTGYIDVVGLFDLVWTFCGTLADSDAGTCEVPWSPCVDTSVHEVEAS